MAFNFNWSPLTADASFYTRAQELLTTALNKSPKPPIIVDDILVNELNLGSVPPDLEILEIGDLAEDRFRGIFKMCYSGDAFLTLKTRVQANPLNTYLSNKPSFASPQPLAAASGLTIPIQISLSEIKLSAFIILVFSRQKGVTLVFRNDPLESLKVSSTFDAIPFVREYLQKEIENQLRVLIMDELPLIIHRLSLRLFVPEYRDRAGEVTIEESKEENPIDPLASPPQDPVDMSGNMIDPTQIVPLSLYNESDPQFLFSQKNLLKLVALTDSHRTLSLFTPNIRDTVFRAWAGPTERGEQYSGKATPFPLSRTNTFTGNPTSTYSFSDSSEKIPSSNKFAPTVLPSSTSTSNMSAKPQKSHGRKKKHRVVNLRKKTARVGDEIESISGDSATNSATFSSATSDEFPPFERPQTPEKRDGEITTPQISPERSELKEPGNADIGMTPPRYSNITPRHSTLLSKGNDTDATPRQSQYLGQASSSRQSSLRTSQSLQQLQDKYTSTPPSYQSQPQDLRILSPSPLEDNPMESTISSLTHPLHSSSTEKAVLSSSPADPQTTWTKMVSLISQINEDNKAADQDFWMRQGVQRQNPANQPLVSSSSKRTMSERGQMNDGFVDDADGDLSPPPAYAL